jgi:hypothetical protein
MSFSRSQILLKRVLVGIRPVGPHTTASGRQKRYFTSKPSILKHHSVYTFGKLDYGSNDMPESDRKPLGTDARIPVKSQLPSALRFTQAAAGWMQNFLVSGMLNFGASEFARHFPNNSGVPSKSCFS